MLFLSLTGLLLSASAQSAPSAEISVDGRASNQTVPTGTVVTVRFKATDPDGNLSGIRLNIWNSTTSHFDNGGGGFIAQSGGAGEVERTFALDAGEWYFWTDAIDDSGNYSSSGDWGGGFHLTAAAANQPPNATISVDGRAPDQTVPTGTIVTVRFKATDPDGNLSGIRLNIWNPTNNHFDNGGGVFISQSGGSGEVERTFALGAGEWYFWTDAQDSSGNYHSSGDWGGGFHLTAVASTEEYDPTVTLAVNTHAFKVGGVLRITSTASDANGNLTAHDILIERPAIPAQAADLSGNTTDVFHHPINYLVGGPQAWNSDNWGKPIPRIGIDPVINEDRGNRPPFINSFAPTSSHPVSPGGYIEIVLDAPGTWKVKATARDSQSRSAESAAETLVVDQPSFTYTTASAIPSSVWPRSVNSGTLVGAYYEPGQEHRGFPVQRSWSMMWQPMQSGHQWDSFWGAHEVHAMVPEAGLTQDILSVGFHQRAAVRLMEVGVDFAIIDHTNTLLFQDVSGDSVLRMTSNIVQGFQNSKVNGRAVKVTMLLGMASGWQGFKFDDHKGTFNSKLGHIYDNWANDKEKWVYVKDPGDTSPDGKPLLLLYTGQEGPWLTNNLPTDTQPYDGHDLSSATYGRIHPDFLAQLKLPDGRQMTEVFTIRYVGALLTTNFYSNLAHYCGEYVINGVTRTAIKTGHWITADPQDPNVVTLAGGGTAAGPQLNVEAVTVRPLYQLYSQQAARNLNRFKQDVKDALTLNPKFLLVYTWSAFGAENDEPSPDRSITVMDNNKFGTEYADALKDALRTTP